MEKTHSDCWTFSFSLVCLFVLECAISHKEHRHWSLVPIVVMDSVQIDRQTGLKRKYT